MKLDRKKQLKSQKRIEAKNRKQLINRLKREKIKKPRFYKTNNYQKWRCGAVTVE